MTTSILNRPAPRWLRDLAHGRAAYEELLGWPVSVQVGNRVLTVAIGASVAAMTMPAGLGATVHRELSVAMQGGPVLTDPDGLKWTFLTRPAELLRPTVAGELERASVDVVPRGSHVVIPTVPSMPIPAGGPALQVVPPRSCHWIQPPTPAHPLPPAYPVIAVTRRLTGDYPLAA